MAITTIYTYPLNGTQRDFTIPFEYLARRFVVLTLIGTDRRELTLTADFRFLTKTLVQTNVAWGPADGYERIEIRRNTSATDRLVDFADGSILRAAELNTSQVQTLHVAEEARNMVADTISENSDGDLDARGRRLVNLADAMEPDHAVTLRQEQAWAESTLSNRNATAAAKDRSVIAQTITETKAGEAMVSAASANSSKVAAQLSETNSKTSELAAKTSETNSKTSELAAKTDADRAAGYAAGLNLPAIMGNAQRFLRVNPAGTGYEVVEGYTKAQVDTVTAEITSQLNALSMAVNDAIAKSQQVLHVADIKPAGTMAGTPSTLNTRVLNTVVVNTIPGASLASNSVTLPAGTYEVHARVPTFGGAGVRVWLQKTDGTTLGSANAYAMNADGGVFDFTVKTFLAASEPITFTVVHAMLTPYPYTFGLGHSGASSQPKPEVYTEVFVRRIK